MKPAFVDLVDLRDGALLVEFPENSDDEANRRAVALGARLRAGRSGIALRDAVPAARSLLVVYDPQAAERRAVGAEVEQAAADTAAGSDRGRRLRIPVVYDGEDLVAVASRAGLPAAELARRHAAARYRVAFVGFSPGFGYLAGLPADLAAPRRTTPRPRVPAGSVAIGGGWTGIYPSASPGGWQLLGRTSAVLFDPGANPPSLLAPGDFVELESVAELPLAPPRPPAPAAASAGRPAFRVLSPGFATSIQGSPRYGLGSSGVPPGGAMDPLALARANAEVGNPLDAPGLEVTLTPAGVELEIIGETEVVVSELGRVRAGGRIRVGRVERGARTYVAVAGGFVDPRGAGEAARRLSAGEILSIGTPWLRGEGASPRPGPLSEDAPLRVVLGPEAGRFEDDQVARFLSTAWRMTPESDRRGLRLEGEPLRHSGAWEIAPSGMVCGTIQVPGSGLPIVLGPDGPVTGGYPRIATVIGADLWRLGQARPGDKLRFEAVTFLEAASLGRAGQSTIGLP